ncbi:MAG: FMN reductase [Ahrensia sp.]|nr:FMN reductase [Ahrensia sp.]
MTPKILVLSGSDRSGSFNKKLAQAAAGILALIEPDVTMIALADYPLPLLGQGGEGENGLPENAVKLAGMIAAHDALFMASPEYNASIPPVVKNALDWVSLVSSNGRAAICPFEGLTVALASASDEKQGGHHVLDHLRTVFVRLGALVVSETCCVPDAANGFGDDDMPRDEGKAAALNAACRSLVEHCTPGRAH